MTEVVAEFLSALGAQAWMRGCQKPRGTKGEVMVKVGWRLLPERPGKACLPVQWGCAGSSELGRDCRPVAKGEEEDEAADTHDTWEQRWPVERGVYHGRKPSLGDCSASVPDPPPPLRQALPDGSGTAPGVHCDAAWTGVLARGYVVLSWLLWLLTPNTL